VKDQSLVTRYTSEVLG